MDLQKDERPPLKLLDGGNTKAEVRVAQKFENIELPEYVPTPEEQSIYMWLKDIFREHLDRDPTITQVLRNGDFRAIYGSNVPAILTCGYFDLSNIARVWAKQEKMSVHEAGLHWQEVLLATAENVADHFHSEVSSTYSVVRIDPHNANRVWVVAYGEATFATEVFAGTVDVFWDNLSPILRKTIGDIEPLMFGVAFAESAAAVVARMHHTLFRTWPTCVWEEGEEIKLAQDGHPSVMAMLLARAMTKVADAQVQRTRLAEDCFRLADLILGQPIMALEDFVNSPEFRQESIDLGVLHNLDDRLLRMLCDSEESAAAAVMEITAIYFQKEMDELHAIIAAYAGRTGVGETGKRFDKLLKLYAIEHLMEIDSLHSNEMAG